MIITFTKSFERSLSDLDDPSRVKQAIQRLIDALTERVKPEGLGLKKLRHDFWEIRVGLRLRVLFELVPGELRLVLVGDHDTLCRFLKHR